MTQPHNVGSHAEYTAMNSSSQNHDPSQSDDLPDRLLDTALTELIGGNGPPDLSSRIAAATLQQPAVVARRPRTRVNRVVWLSLAVAATLLTGVTFALRPPVGSFQTSSLEVAKLKHELQGVHDIARPFPTASTDRLGAAEKTASNAAKTADFDSLTDLVRSTVTTDSYTPEPTTGAKPSSNQVAELFAGRGEGPGGRPAAGPAGKVQVPSQRGSETITWFAPVAQTSSRIQESIAPASTNDDRHGLINDSAATTTPGLAATPLAIDRYASNDRRDDVFRSINHPVILSDGKKISEGGRMRETTPTPTTTQLIAEIHELQRQGKPTDILKKELLKRNEKSVDLSALTAEGIGPDSSGDRYAQIVENPFIKAEGGAAVSTFSIDVDTASYSNVRQFLLQMNQLPPPDAVRIEELVNYFQYDYAAPKGDDEAPFAAHVEVASCPWNAEHRLARIAVKGREMNRNKRPPSNLVFLVDVSGSMNEPAKLPLVVYGLEQLTRELGENDHIAIVVYAGTEGLVLPSTSGSKQDTILAALAKLQAGGSTAGGAGIQLAYQIAEDNFIKGGTNRVILCTDGDFNVGVTNTADLQQLVEKKAKDTGVFLTTLGFGRGNLNDAMMVAISDHGNGNYHYIDNRTEARRVLVEELTGTLVTIAKDVKIQVEFNPAKVAGYRLIGYEKRMLRAEDFNDDKKDAGEIGAGHTVTALYEIIPAGKKVEVGAVDDLKYQKKQVVLTDGGSVPPTLQAPAETSRELLTLKMRYKAPDGDTSKKLEWSITDEGKSFSAASGDLKFAASVAGFGLLLRNSQYKGNLTFAAAIELAQSGIGEDPHGYRKEFLEMVRKAKELRHE